MAIMGKGKPCLKYCMTCISGMANVPRVSAFLGSAYHSRDFMWPLRKQTGAGALTLLLVKFS